MRRRLHNTIRRAGNHGPWTTISDRHLRSVALSDTRSAPLAEIQCRIGAAVQSGATIDVIERDIINRAAIDEEQRSALWLFAEAVIDRPGRLLRLKEDFARAGSPLRARLA